LLSWQFDASYRQLSNYTLRAAATDAAAGAGAIQ